LGACGALRCLGFLGRVPVLDERVHDPRVGGEHREPDAAEGAAGQTTAQLGPGLAAVLAPPDAAAVAAGVEVPGAPSALVARGEQHVRVLRVDRQVAEARVLVDEQRLLPGLAAVCRLEDTALAAPGVERA